MNYFKNTKKWMVAACLLAASPLTTEAIFASELQMQIISVQLKSATLKELFDIIQSKSNYSFLIRNNDINLGEKVSIEMDNKSIEEILTQALKNQHATFEVKDNRIIVYKSAKGASSQSNSQNKTQSSQQHIKVGGKVIDATTGEPIIGANVLVKGKQIGTSTDINGNFTLDVPANAQLTISYIGYLGTEMKAVANAKMTIKMKEDRQTLGEVVVVGYGVQKKENLTGSVNVVRAETIVGKPTTSLANALQGTTPGVTIISRPGDVGKDLGGINVRGRGNLGTSGPLYIIDGVPSGEGDFQRIQSGDIESISILKDAASSSIYGSRAANGVFLVTTKKGKDGKTNVSYNAYYGWQSATVFPKKLGSFDYATLTNEANANAGKKPVYSKEQLDIIQSGSQPNLYPNNDWYSMVYRESAPIQEHNVSVSGGGKTRYFVSGTYFNQQSLVSGRDLTRYNFRSNTERDFTDKFKLGTNISFVRDEYQQNGGNFSSMDLDRMSPMTVAQNPDGTWGSITAGKEAATLAKNNPLREIAEYGRSNYQTSRFNGSLNAVFKPIKDLSITGILSYNMYNSNESTFLNTVKPIIGSITKKPLDGTSVEFNKLTNKWNTSSTLMFQAFASYNKTFGKHDATVMVGSQYETYNAKMLEASRRKFPSNILDVIEAGSVNGDDLGNNGTLNERAFMSQFGRLNYAYDGKYLFEANARIDKSSQFAPENRVGVFPSFSAAWRMSEESFLRDVKWLSNLKLRASWGKLGNVSNVGYYDYFDGLGTGVAMASDGGKASGAWPAKMANRLMTWENVTMSNIGVDAGFFNNKLTAQVDVFNKLTTDILLEMPQPYELGLDDSDSNKKQSPSTNAGKVSNKGIEFSASYSDKIGDFHYGITGNFSKIWNKVEDLNGNDDQTTSYWIYKVGQPIGSFYGYQAEGLFVDENDVKNHMKQDAQTKPGDIKYKDVNGDGKFTAEDRTILGNDVPYFTYGLGFNASYKGFDLSIQGQGVKDVLVYLDGEASQAFFNGAGAKEMHLGRWTAANPNPDAVYPRLLPTSDNAHNSRTSSFWLYSADYFRIKSLILGYTIPSVLTKKICVDKARIYLSGTNLLTFRGDKRMKDFDPETPSSRGSYPNMKVFSFGVNVTF